MEASASSATLRDRVVGAAADLLREGGPDAVSTRAVATAAGTQPPTIYRLFGDKQGLLDAVAAYGFATYIAAKQDATLPADADPLDWLRAGWDNHVAFGLDHPSFYLLVFGQPRPDNPTLQLTRRLLTERLEPLARAGRLIVPIERATSMVQAASVGVVLSLLSMPEEARDPTLSEATRELVLAGITSGDRKEGAGPRELAIALGQWLAADRDDDPALSSAERALMTQWLGTLAGDD